MSSSMAKFSLLFIAIVSVHFEVEGLSPEAECTNNTAATRAISLLVNSLKEENGEWLTTFHAWKADSKKASNNITLDLMHSVVECENDQTIHIKGTIRESKAVGSDDLLSFYSKCGKNAAISNNGRTAQKISLDEPLNGVVLTNRPLRPNELFEVRLDKKHNKFSYSLGIGITINEPSSFTIPDHMYNLKSGNWMMYHTNFYLNGAETLKNYGQNFNALQVGDRIGVMVTQSRALHFYVNGVDQGPAASNIPLTVYGVFELYYNAVMGTIVPSSK